MARDLNFPITREGVYMTVAIEGFPTVTVKNGMDQTMLRRLTELGSRKVIRQRLAKEGIEIVHDNGRIHLKMPDGRMLGDTTLSRAYSRFVARQSTAGIPLKAASKDHRKFEFGFWVDGEGGDFIKMTIIDSIDGKPKKAAGFVDKAKANAKKLVKTIGEMIEEPVGQGFPMLNAPLYSAGDLEWLRLRKLRRREERLRRSGLRDVREARERTYAQSQHADILGVLNRLVPVDSWQRIVTNGVESYESRSAPMSFIVGTGGINALYRDRCIAHVNLTHAWSKPVEAVEEAVRKMLERPEVQAMMEAYGMPFDLGR